MATALSIFTPNVFKFEKAARIVAIIEIAAGIISMMVVLTALLVLRERPELREQLRNENDLFGFVMFFIAQDNWVYIFVPLMYLTCEIVLAVFLYRSIKKRNIACLRIWLIITVTLCMAGAYFFIPGVIFTEDTYHFIWSFMISYIFTGVSICIVRGFMSELQAKGIHQLIRHEDFTNADQSTVFYFKPTYELLVNPSRLDSQERK